MASSRKSGGKQSEDFKQEELLQAVVITDSFNVRFVPVTNSRPRTLLSLINVPFLDYTLQFLWAAGVQRTIVFCCSHADQIKQHLQQSKWSSTSANKMEVITVINEGCLSLGDALRDLEAKSILRSDFVLVHGDLVSNLKLAEIVEEHRRRRQSVKGAAMTMIYKSAQPGHHTRSVDDELVVALQSHTKRVVGHQRIGTSGKKFVLHRESFESHPSVEVHHDILDCHIAICSPVVLQQMADNFDFETIDNLVHEILVNEVLDISVYGHIVDGPEYAARVIDPTTYHYVSQDVMSRWSYPHVPDQNISDKDEDSYAYCRHNVYLARDVVLHRGSTLTGNVAVGSGSIVGEKSTLCRSVIGNRCRIGKNVSITDSYIFDDTVIEDNCRLTKAIVDSNCVLKQNCNVTESVIGSGVHLVSDSVVPSETRLVVGDSHVVEGFNILPFGSTSNLYAYVAEDRNVKLYHLHEINFAFEDLTEVLSSSESEDEIGEVQNVNDEKMLTDEIAVTLERAAEENISSENVIVEINSIKHAYGIQIKELNRLLMLSFLGLPLRNVSVAQSPNSAQYFSKFQSATKRFIGLLKNYFRSRDSQVDMLMAVEDFTCTNDNVMVLLPKIIHYLYDELDMLSEPVILEWWQELEKRNPSSPLRKSLEKFIQWLKTADEDEDDDDDD